MKKHFNCGKVRSFETKLRISISQLGRIPWNKGKHKDGVLTYSGIHAWITREYGQSNYCERCGRTDKNKYEWSNKSHKYLRDISDWQRLCYECHVEYDKKFEPKTKVCNQCGNDFPYNRWKRYCGTIKEKRGCSYDRYVKQIRDYYKNNKKLWKIKHK